MGDYISNIEGQDMVRLMRLVQLLNEGNSLVRLVADHPVTQFTYVYTADRIDVTAQLERGDARGR